MQVAQKKCGLLAFVKPIRLHDCDSITFIQEVTSSQLKIGPKSKPNQYVLVGSLNCIIYLINYNSSEQILKFDLHAFRTSQLGHELQNMLSFLTPFS